MDDTHLALNPVQVKAEFVPFTPKNMRTTMEDNKYYLSNSAAPVHFPFKPPTIPIGPNPTQRCRQIKEVSYASLQGDKGEKCVPKPMQIEVRSSSTLFKLILYIQVLEISNEYDMYLAGAVFTDDEEPHPSKIILPANTTLDYPEGKFSKATANKLEYFQFNESKMKRRRLNEDDLQFDFDKTTRHIYSKISTPGLKK